MCLSNVLTLTALLSLFQSTLALNFLELGIDGLPHRWFPNVSYGLQPKESFGHHCEGKSSIFNAEKNKYEMTFTPNRRVQNRTNEAASNQKLQLAFVLAVGGHSNSHYDYGPAGSINGLLAVWDSWLENFFTFTSNTTSLILLFDERDYKKQTFTHSKKEYLDNILIFNMGAEPVDCVHLRQRGHHHGHHGFPNHPHQHHAKHPHQGHSTVGAHHIQRQTLVKDPSLTHSCSNELTLDQGYRIYYIDVASKNSTNQQPLIIFAAVHNFPKPKWAEGKDEEELFKTWKPWKLPSRYPTNYAYVKMTNWYSYYMSGLRVLDFFDYGGKLDNDVSFVSPFPEPNLPKKLVENQAKMLVTQPNWYNDDPRVCWGQEPCLVDYMEKEAKFCNLEKDKLIPRGQRDPTFWEGNLITTFRAHFLVFWLGLYTAPETRALGKYWNEWHPIGMWDFRWGDQQWWPRPISMFGDGNITTEVFHFNEIDTDNSKYVVHKLWPRWGTIPKVRYYNETGSTREQRDKMYTEAAKQFIY